MSLTKYRALIKVVEEKSYTSAAKSMGYSQPGISKMIESLEAELNTILFHRKGSSLIITESGRIAYHYAKEMVRREDELKLMIRSLNGIITGNLRIGSLHSMILDFVPELLRGFCEQYPIIQISLNQISYGEIIDQLKDGQIDVGFTSRLNSPEIKFISLFKDPARLIVHKSHPLASESKISIKMLNKLEMIMLPPGGDDVVQAIMKEQHFSPIVRFFVHSDDAAIAMVSANLGAYIISDLQCNNLPDDICMLEFEEDVYREMGIAYRSSSETTPAISEIVKTSLKLSENY